MVDNKIKVLQINIGNNLGGVSSLIYNIYLNINKSQVNFDFLSSGKSSYEVYKDEIKKMNGKIYSFNILQKGLINKIKFYKKLKEFLKNNKYDIVHINSGSVIFDFFAALAVKRTCESKIVIHCHSMQNNKFLKKYISKIFKILLSKMGDYYLACSTIAGEAMFSKKIVNSNNFTILNNGIDVKKYEYNVQTCNELRQKYKINKDAIVMGNVARFVKIKNHDFMLEVFNKYHQQNNNSYLVLIGDGELEDEIKDKVKKLNLERFVIFTESVKNVYDYLNMMDIFIFPSISEGFGLAVLESQANGLYTIASTGVPNETRLTPLIDYVSLDCDLWLKKLLNYKKNNNRKSYNEILLNTEYNIKISAEKLLDIYKKMLK